MNPNSLYYGSSDAVPLDSPTQLQFHNVYRMQSVAGPWQNSPHNVIDLSSLGNSDAPEQPLVTPVSTAMYGTTSTCSWAHTVPSLMPWTKEGEVVRFSAPFDPCTSQAATHHELNSDPQQRLKRKSLPEGTEDAPHKMCITEEKMAARFRDMHISNQFTVPCEGGLPAAPPANKSPTNLQQLEIMLQESDSGVSGSKSLILAPEIKKLVEPEKILNTFLNKIEKPSMALVVWQPPNNKLLEGNQKDAMKHNNNLTPQRLSMMCQHYLSSEERQGGTCQRLPEDVMEL